MYNMFFPFLGANLRLLLRVFSMGMLNSVTVWHDSHICYMCDKTKAVFKKEVFLVFWRHNLNALR